MQEASSTSDLVQRAQRGDRQAFADLVDPWLDKLLIRISLRCSPWLRARIEPVDLLQETLLQAFVALPQLEYRSREALGGWLATIANRSISHALEVLKAKRRGGDWRAQALPTTAAFAESGPSPSVIAMRRERIVRLQAALAELRDDYREVLQLRMIEERPVKEVAERMNRSAGAVRMLALRALEELRQVCRT